MKINIQNIDTYLMSYIDNELSLAEKNELELFIKAHPAYAKELALLKQTVLEADEIVYEDKQLLYRFSEMEASLPSAFKKQLYRQEAKVVPGFFTRTNIIRISSIAALFLLFIGYRFYTSGDNLNKASLSQSEKANTKNGNETVIANTEQALEMNNSTKDKSQASLADDNNMFARKNTAIEKGTNFKIVNKKQIISDKQQSDIQSSNLMAFNSNEQVTSANTIVVADINSSSKSAPLTIQPIVEMEAQNNHENTNEISKQAIVNTSTSLEEKDNYENIDTDDHDRSVYIANLEIDGDKIRGFSRRINAIFKRNKNEKQK